MKIISKRLSMSQIKAVDRELFRSLHSIPEVIELCFDAPSPDDLHEKFESRLPTWDLNSTHWLCLTITLRGTGEKVGVTGFKVQDGVAEVGYLLLPRFHGLGYGTESLKSLLNWARQSCGITEFSAIVTEGNVGSERVLEKCGFRLRAKVPDAYQIGGQSYADHCYSIGNIVM